MLIGEMDARLLARLGNCLGSEVLHVGAGDVSRGMLIQWVDVWGRVGG